jgi:RNA polymerase sigma-32 factor
MNTYSSSTAQKMLEPLEETALIEQWIATRDQKYLAQIVQAFTPLVHRFVRQFAMYGIAKEELVSVGSLALVETAHRFDPSKGFKFSTFAQTWIRGMMLIFIATNYFSFAIKTRNVKKIFFNLRSSMQKAQKDGVEWEDLLNSMAEKFEVPKTKIEEVYNLLRTPNISLNAPRSGDGEDGDGGTMEDMLETDVPDPETRIVTDQVNQLRRALVYETMTEVLQPRERIIIKAQMMMEQDEDMTLQDLADQFDLSRERIRQIRNKAFDKLVVAIRAKCNSVEDLQILLRA